MTNSISTINGATRHLRFFRLAVYALLLFSFIATASGCSSKQEPLSHTVQKLQLNNKKGVEAQAQGATINARRLFTEALRLSESIEDFDGITLASINLSRLFRATGDYGTAQKQIDRVFRLNRQESPYYPELAFEQAIILFHAEQLSEAEKWAMLALEPRVTDGQTSRLNLLARIYFHQLNYPAAQKVAREALDAAGENNTETANSYRILGEIATLDGKLDAAQGHFLNALQWDKKAGNSVKVALDLIRLADLSRTQGEAAAELAYLQRAYRVSTSSENLRAIEQVRNRLNELGESGNDRPE